jgi:hypothetical protein
MCDLAGNRQDIVALLEQRPAQATLFFPGHFGPLTREAVLEHFGAPAE